MVHAARFGCAPCDRRQHSALAKEAGMGLHVFLTKVRRGSSAMFEWGTDAEAEARLAQLREAHPRMVFDKVGG